MYSRVCYDYSVLPLLPCRDNIFILFISFLCKTNIIHIFISVIPYVKIVRLFFIIFLWCYALFLLLISIYFRHHFGIHEFITYIFILYLCFTKVIIFFTWIELILFILGRNESSFKIITMVLSTREHAYRYSITYTIRITIRGKCTLHEATHEVLSRITYNIKRQILPL